MSLSVLPRRRALAGAAIVTAALSAGCSPGAAPSGRSTSLLPSTRSATADAPMPGLRLPAPRQVIRLRNPLGPCHASPTQVDPPADPTQTCTYARMIIGHTYPKGQETYLSTVVSQLRAGTGIQLNGHTFVVAAIESYPKASLPDRFYATAGTSRYLVTCDPHSGYTRWADGLLHSKNNLIVTLDPATR